MIPISKKLHPGSWRTADVVLFFERQNMPLNHQQMASVCNFPWIAVTG